MDSNAATPAELAEPGPHAPEKEEGTGSKAHLHGHAAGQGGQKIVSPKAASSKNLRKRGDGKLADKHSSAPMSKLAHEDLDDLDE